MEMKEQWFPIKTLTLDHNAVLLYSKTWVDPDFNPKGIREGFRNETDDGPIYSAKWDPCSETWITVYNTIDVTHWAPHPTSPGETNGSKSNKMV